MSTETSRQVAAVRDFNRYYTRRIGALQDALLESPFSLTEARVLYELFQGGGLTATELGRRSGVDAGYLSRILRRFQERGLIKKATVAADGRSRLLSLGARGRAAFAKLDAAANAEVASALAPLAHADRDRLMAAMHTIQSLLDAPPDAPPYTLRAPAPGDLGWVLERHGAIYFAEYGWDARFEALVAEVVAEFLRAHDPARERCWIAERHGERIGCVMLVRHPAYADVAKLRLLLVEPNARGLGLGRRLVGECTAFARAAGYRKIALWTNSVLHAARHLYEEAGYALVHEERHEVFGDGQAAQTWELDLTLS